MLSEIQWRDQAILITGGTGMVGRHVIEIGQAMGARLHVLARSIGDQSDVTYHTADIRDTQAVHTIIDTIKPRAIIHLAAMGVGYGDGEPSDEIQTNVNGLQNVLVGATNLDPLPSIVIADTGFVYASQNRPIAEDDPIDPFNFYAHSKVVASEVARHHAQHLPITLLRLFSLYSPYESLPRLLPHIVQSAQQGDAIELTACEQVRDYAFAGDVAEAFWRALSLESNGQLEIINIGNGRSVTLREFVETVGRILTDHGIQTDFRFGARPYRDNELMTYVPNLDKMCQRLGWTFPTNLETGLGLSVEAMLEQTG